MTLARVRNASRSRPISAPRHGSRGVRLAAGFFGDPGGSPGALAEIVELRPTDGATRHDLDLVETRGVHGERPLDAHAVRRLAHGEPLAVGTPGPRDDR